MSNPLKQTRYIRWQLMISRELLKGKDISELPTFEVWSERWRQIRNAANRRFKARIKSDPERHKEFRDLDNKRNRARYYLDPKKRVVIA